MSKTCTLILALAALAIGCTKDVPHDYGRERPPVGDLYEGDKGLQSKDVLDSAHQMAMDLLAAPELNASRTQWVMVVMNVQNKTVSSRGDLDIFIRALRKELATQGKGRVQLVENKAQLREMQNKELDNERDDFGQGGGATPRTGRLQPDFGLYATAYELPNRRTSFYQIDFTVTDLKSGIQSWSNSYQVKVAR